jgi:hypothetical protein
MKRARLPGLYRKHTVATNNDEEDFRPYRRFSRQAMALNMP